MCASSVCPDCLFVCLFVYPWVCVCVCVCVRFVLFALHNYNYAYAMLALIWFDRFAALRKIVGINRIKIVNYDLFRNKQS